MKYLKITILLSLCILFLGSDFTRFTGFTRFTSFRTQTTGDVTAPIVPSSFIATAVDSDSVKIEVSGWAADIDTFRLMAKIGSYPTLSDSLVIAGSDTSLLSDSTFYLSWFHANDITYFTLYVGDAIPNWATAQDTAHKFWPIDAYVKYFWRSDVGVTTSNDSVSAWIDSVGLINFTQATAKNKPVFNSDSNSIFFMKDSVSTMAGSGSITLDTTQYTIDFMFKVSNKDTAYNILTQYVNSSNQWRLWLTNTSVGQVVWQTIIGAAYKQSTLISAALYTANQRTVISISITAGTSINWYVNGSSIESTILNNLLANINNAGTLTLNGQSSTTNQGTFYLWTIRINNKARTAAEALDFYNWCKQTF